MTQQAIAAIGLGSMGYGMAQSLLRAGHKVFGQDVMPEPLTRLRAEGAQARDLNDAIAEIDIAVVTVLNAEQMVDVLFGEAGIAPKLKPDAVIIACATMAPAITRELAARTQALSLHYLDAPISGGAVKAAAGQLSIMASGSPAAFIRARPALDAMAETVFELGDDAGIGSAMKALNQLLAGVHIAAMAEAMTLGISQGISPQAFMETIPRCAGTSWMLENRGPHIRDGDYIAKSAIDIWPKDLGIVLDMAKTAKFGAPLTAAALQQFMAASGSGLGREDDAAIAKVYARNAGLKLPGD